MSVCFYHDFGRMLGVDVHRGFPLLVFTDLFTIWPRTFWCETATVRADGFEMIQEGYDLYLVPHIPPPNPKAVAVAAEAIATSSSKPFLHRSSVKGEGKALACCSASFIGLNANCWDAGVKSLPSGVVVSPTSVVTTPTAGDYATAVVGLALGNLTSLGVGKLVGKTLPLLPSVVVKHVLRRLPDLYKVLERQLGPTLAPILIPILLGPVAPLAQAPLLASKAKKAVGEWVDRALA